MISLEFYIPMLIFMSSYCLLESFNLILKIQMITFRIFNYRHTDFLTSNILAHLNGKSSRVTKTISNSFLKQSKFRMFKKRNVIKRDSMQIIILVFPP